MVYDGKTTNRKLDDLGVPPFQAIGGIGQVIGNSNY
jgi:hypothetical protein